MYSQVKSRYVHVPGRPEEVKLCQVKPSDVKSSQGMYLAGLVLGVLEEVRQRLTLRLRERLRRGKHPESEGNNKGGERGREVRGGKNWECKRGDGMGDRRWEMGDGRWEMEMGDG
jgi:hypothetical protein